VPAAKRKGKTMLERHGDQEKLGQYTFVKADGPGL
jgi:hypothetical protein